MTIDTWSPPQVCMVDALLVSARCAVVVQVPVTVVRLCGDGATYIDHTVSFSAQFGTHVVSYIFLLA